MTHPKRTVSILTVIILPAFLLFSCSGDREAEKREPVDSGTPKPVIASDEEFHGWDSLTLRNVFVRFNVVPDLGGKIMGFDLHGYQLLWHDPAKEGFVDTDQGYGFGGKFFNPGGAKVWPAPQGWSGPGEWPGPPDDVLDSAPYDCYYDDDAIVVESPPDDGPGRTGLRFTHTYRLVPGASLLDLDLSMTNVVDRPVNWGLWHLATLPVDRAFTVYVPVDDGDWHVILGDEDNPQWLGVEDGLFRARYDRRVGKVGMKVREGWAAWHDEENDVVFAMLFTVDRNARYPDGGSQFEIWTNGAGSITAGGEEHTYEYSPESAFMELEVMGPLTDLTPDERASMNVRWGVCRCSGVLEVNEAGVIVEKLKYENEKLTGKFGVFYGGLLQTVYLSETGERLSIKNLMEVSPLSEVTIAQDSKDIITWRAKTIRFQVTSFDKSTTKVIAEVDLK